MDLDDALLEFDKMHSLWKLEEKQCKLEGNSTNSPTSVKLDCIRSFEGKNVCHFVVKIGATVYNEEPN